MNIYNTEDFNDMFDVINENFNFFFNNLSFSRLLIRENFENFVNLSIAFVFDESN